MNAILGTLLWVSILAAGTLPADDLGFAFHPFDAKITLLPGEHGTVMLYIESALSGTRPRMDLTASAVDWSIENDGAFRYFAAGTSPNSAARWMSVQPAVIPLVPGELQRVQVTVKVPGNVDPGFYRLGLWVSPNRDLRASSDRNVFRMTVHVLAPPTIPKWRAAP